MVKHIFVGVPDRFHLPTLSEPVWQEFKCFDSFLQVLGVGKLPSTIITAQHNLKPCVLVEVLDSNGEVLCGESCWLPVDMPDNKTNLSYKNMYVFSKEALKEVLEADPLQERTGWEWLLETTTTGWLRVFTGKDQIASLEFCAPYKWNLYWDDKFKYNSLIQNSSNSTQV